MTNTELVRAVDMLHGLPCWSVIAGKGTGSVILLQMGAKKKRIPSPNPNLSLEEREFEGEWTLFIHCVWRIDTPSAVICGGWDSNEKGGPMLTGLKRLVGTTIEEVHLEPPAWDLVLRFQNGLWLKVFCDKVAPEGPNNYSIGSPEGTYIVGPRGKLSLESEESADESKPR